MDVTLPLLLLLVIFGITAHAELSGPSQGEALHFDCPTQRTDYTCVKAEECPKTFPIDMSSQYFCPLEEEICCRKSRSGSQ